MNWLRHHAADGEAKKSLHVEFHGSGSEKIVFVAGLGGTTRYWATRVQSIEDCYRVILVDLLGFGRSPKPWMKYTVDRQVDALHATLSQFAPFSLVGHSLGALVAVAYAARHPDHIKNIVLIGMPYFGSQTQAYRYMHSGKVQWGFLYTNFVLAMVACVITRRVFGWLLPYVVRSVPREVAEDLVKHTWRSSTSSLWDVVYRYDIGEDLERLPGHIKLLFVHGDQDTMAPLAAVKRLVAEHPEWRLAVHPGVDHHPFLRNPKGCLMLVDELIQSDSHVHSMSIRSSGQSLRMAKKGWRVE